MTQRRKVLEDAHARLIDETRRIVEDAATWRGEMTPLTARLVSTHARFAESVKFALKNTSVDEGD